jgi:hypothetical protein
MIATHQIQNINFQENLLIIKVDGQQYEFQLSEISKKLANASEVERNFFKISSSGYGIHWPLIDEDLSMDALLKR